MNSRMIAVVATTLLAGQAHALPLEAIGSFFTKLFKGGAAKEAMLAERASMGAAGMNGLGRVTTGDAVRAGPILQAVDLKPDLAADVVAKSHGDAINYKALRVSAGNGDAAAMMKMSEMTDSGMVSDPGEPWRGYWMFQAARLGSQVAARKSRNECSSGESRRTTDRWFDSACGPSDGRSFYIVDKLPGVYSSYRTEFIANPISQPGMKQ